MSVKRNLAKTPGQKLKESILTDNGIPLERIVVLSNLFCQGERIGANFSSVAPSSEEL